MQVKHIPALRVLAQLYGVQTAYYDVYHRRQEASMEALLQGLRALGAPVERLDDVPEALRQRRQALGSLRVSPVAVSWDGHPAAVELRLPADQSAARARWELRLENGEVVCRSVELAGLPIESASRAEGRRYVVKTLQVPESLPLGYHSLTLEVLKSEFKTLIVAAPSSSYVAGQRGADRSWGVFLPLYALRSEKSWGAGDFSDLEKIFEWVAGLGGRMVGTLPLLATFLDALFDPSPYAPASRLFWNEFYVDPMRLPEFLNCPPAQAVAASPGFKQELAALRSSALVDYRRQIALKRSVLEKLARSLFATQSGRYEEFRRFAESYCALEDYACFRAAVERRQAAWPEWPQPARDGVLTPSDYDEDARRYHLYVQWAAHEQLQSVSEKAREAGGGLYLDAPLGVHPASYDSWRERDAFALDARGGAPPDAVFTKGQNWNFPPLHPERIREQGYRYFIAGLRHQLAHAALLRIDHVMGLHRLFWIPKGLDARQGVYVRYNADELYAIVNLESHRHKAGIVGENLGTVPAYVNRAMAEHKIQRMYVVQYELSPEHRRALHKVPAGAVASLNTHDMPPFAAFLRGLDLADRLALGLLDEEGARDERRLRESVRTALFRYLLRQERLGHGAPADESALIRACLDWLSAGPVQWVLVNLEDLWEEIEPQNVPGTLKSRPNWQKKARYSFEEFSRMPRVVDALRSVDRFRTREKGVR